MCSPRTAVAFVKLKSRLLLLTCEGPWLWVYDQLTRRVLGSKHLFDGQAVHGITSPSTNYDSTSEPCHTQVLVWGGCSVCVVRIENDEEFSDHSDWRIQVTICNAQAEDWILDACFSPRASISESLVKCFSRAVLVTSHNVLLSLHIPLALSTKDGNCMSIHRLANGPRSILYSAHVIWPSHGPGLVAAGTVYGEVLLWSFLSSESTSYSSLGIPGILNSTFKGHEGSVFGVRISEEFSNGESGTRRILASCSDDRTIRIWSIDVSRSQTMHDGIQKAFDGSVRDLSGGYVEEQTSQSLVMAMGHASRIWDIRFLDESKSNWHLLSLGEDGTAQTWHLQQLSDVTGRDAKSKSSPQFLHRSTFKFHSGKNIWANAVHQQGDSSLICTGGADGRLVCFTLSRQNSLHLANTLSSQWTLGEVLKDLDKGSDASGKNLPDATEVDSSCRTIFTAFEGHWKLVRHLSSVIPTYPSGVLEGSANFEKRSPTDPMYDAEYLYIENGIFTTEHGVSLVASRRYVYRFEKDSEKISAWFVKSDHGSTVDYLFHNLNFKPLKDASSKMKERAEIDTLIAMGHHPCVDDKYQADYNFQLRGCTLDRWSLKYTVRGPNKDYIADARYVREDVTLRLETESESDQIVKEASKTMNTLQHEVSGDLSQTSGSFKSYTWVNENEFLVSSEKGLLLLGNLTCSRKRDQVSVAGTSPQILWEKIANIPDLKFSCITTSILSHEIVIFAGTTGAVYVYRHEKRSIHSPIKTSSKVAYLNSHLLHRPPSVVSSKTSEAFDIAVIISCVGTSKVHLLILDAETKFSDFSVSLNIALKRSPGFIVTSACFLSLEDILVLGSRGGALAIYASWRNWNGTVEVPNPYYLHHIHDEDTVTNIQGLPGGKSKSDLDAIYFVTTGRNGTYAVHQISLDTSNCETPVKFKTVHMCTPPFGPNVEGACFDRVTSDLLLWGFRSKQFVVWNETQKKELMTVECGGSHRNWAFSPPSNGSSGGTLVWTKASVCKVHSQPNASHQVFQSGGHGREIKAMALSPPVQVTDGSMRRYVATGAEDTAIRIFDGSVDKEAIPPQDFRCLGLFTKHSTGIQQLRWSSCEQLLFSAAGCEEFFVWRMSSVPCLEIGLVCEACCPQVTESSDLRIMDFDVAEIRGADDSTGGDFCVQAYLLSMVYSDSSIRVRIAAIPIVVKMKLKGGWINRCFATTRPESRRVSNSSSSAITRRIA